jgi:HrpA-like RNA helicase
VLSRLGTLVFVVGLVVVSLPLHVLCSPPPSGSLTPLGSKMASLPVDPAYGSLLLRAEALKCVADVIDIIAMLSTDSIFYLRRDDAEKAATARARYALLPGLLGDRPLS